MSAIDNNNPNLQIIIDNNPDLPEKLPDCVVCWSPLNPENAEKPVVPLKHLSRSFFSKNPTENNMKHGLHEECANDFFSSGADRCPQCREKVEPPMTLARRIESIPILAAKITLFLILLPVLLVLFVLWLIVLPIYMILERLWPDGEEQPLLQQAAPGPEQAVLSPQAPEPEQQALLQEVAN